MIAGGAEADAIATPARLPNLTLQSDHELQAIGETITTHKAVWHQDCMPAKIGTSHGNLGHGQIGQAHPLPQRAQPNTLAICRAILVMLYGGAR